MNHSTKILLRITVNRIKNAIRAEVNECQYGFMPDKGTQNAVYVLNRIAERSKQVQKKVFCCFIDYTKAFNRGQHNILFEILSDLDVNDKDIRLMHSLYFGQKANIRVCNTKSENVDVKKGVRQGCAASPDLFSLYSELIMRAKDRENGVNIGGHNTTNIGFADDTALTANTADDLQTPLEKTNAKCRKFGMEIDTKKTVIMVLNGDGKVKTEIKLNGEVHKEVEKFKYLGSWITINGGHMTDIECRIAETKKAFADIKNKLADFKMPFDLRYRILNCYVMPILLYGCENWILNQQQIKRLEATELWFIRRMQKISWKEKKTNEQVLRETIGKRKLIQQIVQRQVSFFGHFMRKGQLENIVTTAKINGKRKRGKPSIQYMDQIKKWTQQESIESLILKIYERTLLVAQVY